MKRKITGTGLVEAACALVAFCTVAGFFGGWSWVLELFDHFRLHYAFGALVFGLLAWWASRRRWALVCLVMLIVNISLCPAVFSFVSRQTPAPDQAVSLRFTTINVLTSNQRYEDVLLLVRSESPDVILLMEVNGTWWEKLSVLLDDYRLVTGMLRPDNFGIALMVRKGIDGMGEVFYPGQMRLPAIRASLATESGHTFHVLGVHTTPPGSREYHEENIRMLKDVESVILTLNGPLVVLGDVNTTPWSVRFRKFIAATNLKDSAKQRGYLATWPTMAAPVLRIPLDHILVSPDIRVSRRWLGGDVGSDHLPLFADLDIPPSPNGK